MQNLWFSLIEWFRTATVLDWITQILGIFGILAAIIAFQCKKHKPLMIFRTANETLFGVQYLLLGAYTGMAMNFVGSVRNIVFTVMVAKKKNTIWARALFSLFFIVFVIFTWDGFKSVLVGFAKVLSTFGYGSSNPYVVRFSILITSSCWLVYNLCVRSYAGAICEIMTLISIAISFFRLNKEGNEIVTEDLENSDN